MSEGDKSEENIFKNIRSNENFEELNNERIELHQISSATPIEKNDLNLYKRANDQNEQQLQQQQQDYFAKIKILNEKNEELFIQGCGRREDVSTILSSFVSKSLADDISVLIIQSEGDYGEISSDELTSLGKIFTKRDVVVVLNPKNSQKSSIFWKSKVFNHFLSLNPFDGSSSDENKNLHEFIVIFLVGSLENGHSGLISTYTINPESHQIDLDLLADHRNYNLLLIAAEHGNVLIVRKLLQLGMISDLLHVDAQTLAWNKRHFDVLLELLEANLTYPKSFDIKKCPPNLKEFYLNSNELHKAIKSNNKEGIEAILNQNSSLKYCYNTSNNSALKTAIDAKAPEIYDILLEKKLRFGPHEDVEELYEGLEYEMKRTLREIHSKHSQVSDEKHLNILMANSFISHDDDNAQKKVEHIQRAFQILNMNVFIRIILMIVAASKKFKIIFDFNRDSVNIIDPTVESNTQGLFYLSGRIYIGAKQLLSTITEHETFGVIAHELCHYAVNVVYGNDAKPYISNDNQTIQEFEKISEGCHKNYEKEGIVDLVYDCYPQEAHHAELIVRVVHMLAFYYNQPGKILELRGYFGELFNFYESKVVPEMKAALPEIEKKVEDEIKKKDEKISKLKKRSIIFGILAVLGIVGGIAFAVISKERKYEFSELSKDEMYKVKKSLVNYKNIDIKFDRLFKNNSAAYTKLKSPDISDILKGKLLNLSHPDYFYLNSLVVLNWTSLAEDLKEVVLDSDLLFQNESVKLNNLYNVSKKTFDFLNFEQIKTILEKRSISIGSIIENDSKFVVERKFFLEDIYPIYYDYMNNVTHKYHQVGFEVLHYFEINRKFEDIYDEYASKNFSDFTRKIDEIRDSEEFKSKFHSDFFVSSNDTVTADKKYQLNFIKVVEIVKEKRMFILSADAGMGKTFTFEDFALKLKKKFPLRWVFYIDLKDHVKHYTKQNLLGNEVEFLENILKIDTKNNFDRELFTNFYKTGNLILLWNGFDEISTAHREFILNVTNSIHTSTKNIQFVCTRPLYSRELRDKFNVLTYTLVPFDRHEQDEFLEKLFETKKINSTLIQAYVNRTYEIITSLRSDSNVIGDFNSPLMLKMIGSLIANGEKIFKSGNLYQIYDQFVKTKVKIWQDKSTNASNFLNQQATSRFNIIDVFQKYALMTEFPEIFTELNCEGLEKLKIFQTIIPKRFSKEDISSIGILHFNDNDDVQFAHKTFAEFFIAQYVIESIYNAKPLHEDEAEQNLNLFYRIVKSHADGKVVTGNFFNSYILDETEDEFYSETFDSKLINVLMKRKPRLFFDFLGNYYRETRIIKTFELLFNFFKKDHKLLTDLLQVYGKETLYTSVFNLYTFNNKQLKDLSRKYLSDDEYLRFINGINQKGNILFSMVKFSIGPLSESTALDFSDYILPDLEYYKLDHLTAFKILKNHLTEGEFKETFLIESGTVINHFFTTEAFWEIAEEALNESEFKIFVKIVIKKCALSFYYQVDSFPFIFDKVNEIFSDSEIREFFLSNDILHKASTSHFTVLRYLWNFYMNHTTDHQQKEIILYQGSDQFNQFLALHIHPLSGFCSLKANIFQTSILSSCHLYNFKDKYDYVKEVYKGLLNENELQEMILNSGDFLFYAIKICDLKHFEVIVSFLKEIFKGRENDLQKFAIEFNEIISHPYDLPQKNVNIFKTLLNL